MDMKTLIEGLATLKVYKFDKESCYCAKVNKKAWDLYLSGDTYAAAQVCLDLQEEFTSFFDVYTHNLLIFLIRYEEPDIRKLHTHISLNIEDLLETSLMEYGESYGGMVGVNIALYLIELGRYKSAMQIFDKMTAEDWGELYIFWRKMLWEDAKNPEGALICALGLKYGAFEFPKNEKDKIVASVNTMYRDFWEFATSSVAF